MWSGLGNESSKRLRSSRLPDIVSTMTREISAGGVVLRQIDGVWHVAVIEPQKSEPANNEPAKETRRASKTPHRRRRAVFTLPKGLVDPGEKPQTAAVREVLEETGVVAEPVIKLADNKYVYVRSWGDGERVFKIVSFYLLRYESGRIDNVSDEMRVEVARAKWLRLEDAPKLLAYRGEKQMARKALEYFEVHVSDAG